MHEDCGVVSIVPAAPLEPAFSLVLAEAPSPKSSRVSPPKVDRAKVKAARKRGRKRRKA